MSPVTLRSNNPIWNIGVRIRSTDASTYLVEIFPARTSGSRTFFIFEPPGISWSRPSTMEAECVAPQSKVEEYDLVCVRAYVCRRWARRFNCFKVNK